METLKFLLIFLAAFVVIVHADLPHFDEYWNVRAVEAKENTIEAYHPDPFNVTNKFNYLVNQATIDLNGTRRSLFRKNRKKGGPCVATNPIDQCWRCNPKWAENRKRLAECALGFGYKTTGGKNGKFYVVTDPSDNDMVNPKPGTLRYAVIQKVPLWITFSRNMVIRLNQELIMTGDKTIDARGAQVHISGGAGLTLQFIKNVIIHGLYIHDIVVGSGGMIRDSVDHYGFRTQSDGDGISIFGSTNVWIDHVSMSKCQDGLIDAIMGSTAVTISNCHFTDHNEVMLFGASDGYTGDTLMQITVAFNHFGKGLVQRMPRCRYGFVHVVNNDYTHWRMYAIGGSRNPTIISQGNRFIAPNDLNCKQVTKREYAMESEWKNWNWRSQEDLLMNGAYFVQSGNSKINRKFTSQQIIKSKPGSFVSKLTRSSGPLGCCVGRAC